HPDGLGVTGHLADVPAVCLPLGVQRLQAGTGPVLTLVGAAEQTSAGNGEDRPRAPAADQHAMHVYRVIVQVVTVAHVVPVLTTVEATNDATDFDSTVQLIGIRRIGRQ